MLSTSEGMPRGARGRQRHGGLSAALSTAPLLWHELLHPTALLCILSTPLQVGPHPALPLAMLWRERVRRGTGVSALSSSGVRKGGWCCAREEVKIMIKIDKNR